MTFPPGAQIFRCADTNDAAHVRSPEGTHYAARAVLTLPNLEHGYPGELVLSEMVQGVPTVTLQIVWDPDQSIVPDDQRFPWRIATPRGEWVVSRYGGCRSCSNSSLAVAPWGPMGRKNLPGGVRRVA